MQIKINNGNVFISKYNYQNTLHRSHENNDVYVWFDLIEDMCILGNTNLDKIIMEILNVFAFSISD